MEILGPALGEAAVGEQCSAELLVQRHRIGLQCQRAGKPAQSLLELAVFHEGGGKNLDGLGIIRRKFRCGAMARERFGEPPLVTERRAEKGMSYGQFGRQFDRVAADCLGFTERPRSMITEARLHFANA